MFWLMTHDMYENLVPVVDVFQCQFFHFNHQCWMIHLLNPCFFSKKYNARDLQFQHCSFKVIWNGTTNQKVYVSCLRTTTWSPSSTSDASKRPNDLEASFFLDFGWCIGESGAQSAILWNLFVFFLLFAKFGLKTNALLLEKMLMEMFYTGFHIYSKQFSLYPLVMWSSKTYILTILYNNVFSSDS